MFAKRTSADLYERDNLSGTFLARFHSDQLKLSKLVEDDNATVTVADGYLLYQCVGCFI